MGKSELQFGTKAEALKYIEENNWDYLGRQGWLHKYDKYQGTNFYMSGENEYSTSWHLKLFPDGYITVKAIRDTSGSIPTGGFGGPLWRSVEDRDFYKKLTKKVNHTLKKEGSPLYVKFVNHPLEFLLLHEDEIDKIDVLRCPTLAIDYGKETKLQNGNISRGTRILVDAISGHWYWASELKDDPSLKHPD